MQTSSTSPATRAFTSAACNRNPSGKETSALRACPHVRDIADSTDVFVVGSEAILFAH